MNGETWKVLVVDDSPEDRAEVRRLLLTGSDRRYKFVEAETGAAALRLCDDVDCAVLDYRLPDMDAPEVLAGMRHGRETTCCPVVVLTGTAAREMASGVLRAGAMDYLGKSWTNAESLTRAVENAVERFAMLRELREREEEVRASEERLRRLGDNLPDVAVYQYTHQADGRPCFQHISAGIERLIGVSVAEVLRDASVLHRQIPEGHLSRLLEAEARSKSELSELDLETPMCRPDGAVRWMHLHSRPRRTPDGRVIWDGVQTDITARKQAEEALRASEERYRVLADALPHMTWVTRPDHSVEYANRMQAAYTGLSVEELNAVGWPSLVHPDDQDRLWAEVAGPLARGEPHEAEYRLRWHDGSYHWVITRAVPVTDPAGRVERWVGTTTDIDAQKRAEEAARASQATLQSFYDSAPMLMGIAELDGEQIVAVSGNRAVAEFFGTIPDRLSGQAGPDLGTPADVERLWVECYRRSQETGTPVHFEYEHLRPTGACWLSATVAFLGIGPTGRPRFSFVCEDVTDRKRAEEVLRESEGLFRTLAATAPVGIFRTDADGACLFVSEWWIEIAGMSAEQARGAGWAEALHPDDRAAVIEQWGRAARNREPLCAEYRFVHPSGRVTWVVGRAVPEGGGYVGTITDITALKHAEEDRVRAIERADVAQRAAQATFYDFRPATGEIIRSATMKDVLGYTPEELEASKGGWRALIHPDDVAAFDAAAAGAVIQGTPVALEYRVRHKAGQWVWMSDQASVVRNAAGEVERIVGLVKDVTDRRLAEQAVRASEDFRRRSFDQLAAFAGVLDLDGTLIEANRAPIEAAGLTRADVLGKPFWECSWWSYAPDVQARLRDAIARARAGETVRYDESVMMANGLMPIDFQLAPLRDETGRVTHLIPSAVDITERKRVEEALRESEERFRSLVELSPQFVWLADADGSLTYCNQWWYEYTGLTPERTVGWGWAEAVHPDHRDRLAALWRQTVDTEGEWNAEIPFRRADGEYRWHLGRGQAVRGDDGRVLRWLGIGLDIHDRKQAEEALNDALADMRMLHRLAMDMARPGDTQEFYERLMDAAVEVMRSDFASIQMLHPERGQPSGKGELRLLAYRGFPPEAAAHWEWVTADSTCSCGIALTSGQRCDVYDTVSDARVTGADRDTYLKAGIRAVQTTPLVARDGRLLGVISTHWKTQHQASERDFRLFDVLVRHAADLLERVQAEQTIRKSEERLRLALEASDTGLWEWVPETDAVTWSPECYRIHGLAEGEFGGTEAAFFARVHPDDRVRVEAAVRAAIKARGLYECEFRIVRPDGEVAWVANRGRASYDAAGRPIRVLGTITDITPRVQAELALRASEERFHLAVRAVNGVVWEWDLRTGHVFRSDGLYALIGVRPEDAAPTREWWAERIHPDDLARLMATADDLLATADQFSGDYRVRHEDGRWIDVWERGLVERDADGHAVRLVGFTADVTERKRAEEALKEADRRKDVFLAMLAHELRNPLAPIRNAIQLLRLTGPKEAAVESASDLIERQVTHLIRLVDDLLDVSRVSRGKIQLQKVVLDLAAVAKQAVETSQPVIDARRHRLAVTLPQGPVRVEGDFTRLAQVISNLLNNAAKYTDEGGNVWLIVEQSAGEAVVRVRDNGRGIDPAALGSLFDLFYQVDRNLDRSDGGLGIGLSLVKSLAEMHGGRVEASSAGRGKGSEFVLRLPLLRETLPAVRAEAPSAKANPSRGLRVLVVDDNRDSAQSMALLLQLEGHNVLTAYDGKRAVEIALHERPEVVLLDIGLPYLDGHQACKAMRDGGLTDALIVAMTGYGQEEDRARSQTAGFDAHQVKPVDLHEVRQLLARQAAKRC